MFAAHFQTSAIAKQNFETPFLSAMSPMDPNPTGQVISGKTWIATSHENTPETVSQSTDSKTYVSCLWGRLENLSELRKTLNAPQAIPADLMWLAWQKWGPDFPKHLKGDFAIALHSLIDNHTILARDALGVRPLYYHLCENAVVAATTPKAILNTLKSKLKRNPRWIALFIIEEPSAAHHTETAYVGLNKVAGGHVLIVKDAQAEQNHQWHHWTSPPIAKIAPDPKWVTKHKELFRSAVLKRISGKTVVSETSAGIDSSSIIATLVQEFEPNQTERLLCHGTDEGGLSKPLIQELSKAKGGLQTRIANKAKEPPKNHDLQIMGFPIGHGNYIPHNLLEKYRNDHDVRVVFSGFGGDEVATNFAHGFAQECLDLGDFKRMYQIQEGNILTKLLRLIKRIRTLKAMQSKTPAPLTDLAILRQSARDKYNLHDHLKTIGYGNGVGIHINSYIIDKELKNPNIPNRFECHTIFANAYGMEYRWPFWDADLVQNYLDTPSVEKYGPNATSRYLHKRAMNGLVPDSINWRKNKDLEAPRGEQLPWHDELKKVIDLTEKLVSNWHPDLDEFVDREEIKNILTGPQALQIDYETFELYGSRIYALSSINDWMHADD